MGVQEKVVNVRIGADLVPMHVDAEMTAGDLKRELNLNRRDYIVRVNNGTLTDGEKILRYIASDRDEVEILPVTDVGASASSIFLTGERRHRQEEVLLRKIGFVPVKDRRNRYVGIVRACGRTFKMFVTLPETFPYSRPVITINDPWFLNKHPCIVRRGMEIEIHFHDEDWDPRMHASQLALNAIRFLKSFERDYCPLGGADVWTAALMRLYWMLRRF